MAHRPFIAALLLALGLRLLSLGLVYSEHPERVVTADAVVYEQAARAILAGGGFAKGPEELGQPQTLRTPGYSLFMALGFTLFGQTHLPLILAQIALSGLILCMTYLMGLKLFGPGPALLAAGLLALEPNGLLFCQLLQTETLFTVLLLGAALAGLKLGKAAKPASRRWAALFSLLLACATLVRPISYFLFWPLMGWMLFHALQRGATRRALAGLALALLIPWLLLVGGWQARNYLVSGSAQFSQLQAMLLLDYQASAIVARQRGVSLDQARGELRAQAESGLAPGASEATRYQAYQRLAGQVLREHPLGLAREVVLGLGKVLVSPMDATFFDFYGGDSSLSGSLGDLARLSPGAYLAKWSSPELAGYFVANALGLLFLLLWYLGLLRAAPPLILRDRAQRYAHVFLWLITLYLLAAPAGPGGSARFRIPASPMLALYAAWGLMSLWSRVRASKSGGAA